MKKLTVKNKLTQKLLGKVLVADSFWLRFRGLLYRKKLNPFEGLILIPCKQVHTIGISYPLSIWFLDKEGRIIKIIDMLKPYRISPYVKDSYSIIEFPETWAEKTGTKEGDFIELTIA